MEVAGIDGSAYQHQRNHLQAVRMVLTVQILLIVLAVYGYITFKILNLMSVVQPEPYLDEVFHIPQALNYCRGEIGEWNPKITTLPGLYIISALALHPLSAALETDFCTTYGLRFVNTVVCLCNLVILYNLYKIIHFKGQSSSHVLQSLAAAINMSLLPVLYFFSFLYYTDMISTTFVLLMYYFVLKKSPFWSALAGFISVTLRQTNIIWVMLSLAVAVRDCIQNIGKKRDTKDVPKEEDLLTALKNIIVSLVNLWNEGRDDLKVVVKAVMSTLEGFLVVIFSFICFVLLNGGIVAGDKSAHVSVINIPQVFYFILFFTFFSGPYAVTHVKSFFKLLFSNKWKMMLAIMLCALTVHLNTEVHPYLLADNRHYTFYLWKRVYERHYLYKYLMVAIYLFGAHVVDCILRRTESFFHLGFLVFLILCLVPQKLLEFRYFIIPFLLLRLQVVLSKWQSVLEFILFASINYITIHIFVTKPFFWQNSEDVQRFLW